MSQEDCPQRSGRLRIIAAIEDPPVMANNLAQLNIQRQASLSMELDLPLS